RTVSTTATPIATQNAASKCREVTSSRWITAWVGPYSASPCANDTHTMASAMTPYARGSRNAAITMVTPAVMPNRPTVSAYAHTSGARTDFGGCACARAESRAHNAGDPAGEADPADREWVCPHQRAADRLRR